MIPIVITVGLGVIYEGVKLDYIFLMRKKLFIKAKLMMAIACNLIALRTL